MKKKFVLCILVFILILIGFAMWFTLSAREDVPPTPTAKADTSVEEDTVRSVPYGFESDKGTTWILPHWTLDGKLFKVDKLPDNFKPLDDRFKLIHFPKYTETKVQPTEEPIVEVIVEPEEPAVDTFVTQDKDMGSDWTLTFYCPCAKCNGIAGQPTASGRMPEVGVTVGVDPKLIKLESYLRIEIPDGNGGYTVYRAKARADDTGGAVKGNKIDVFVGSHQEAINLGVIRNARVYLIGEQK